MFTRKSLISASLATVLVFSMSACSGKDEGGVPAPLPTTNAEQTTEPQPTPTETTPAGPVATPIEGTNLALSGEAMPFDAADGTLFQIPAPTDTWWMGFGQQNDSQNNRKTLDFFVNSPEANDLVSSYQLQVIDYTNEPLTTERFERTAFDEYFKPSGVKVWRNFADEDEQNALHKIDSFNGPNGTWTRYLARIYDNMATSVRDVNEFYYVNEKLKLVIKTDEIFNQFDAKKSVSFNLYRDSQSLRTFDQNTAIFGSNAEALKRSETMNKMVQAIANGICAGDSSDPEFILPTQVFDPEKSTEKLLLKNSKSMVVAEKVKAAGSTSPNDPYNYLKTATMPLIKDSVPVYDIEMNVNSGSCMMRAVTNIPAKAFICLYSEPSEMIQEKLDGERDQSNDYEETISTKSGEWIAYHITKNGPNREGEDVVIKETQRFYNVKLGVMVSAITMPDSNIPNQDEGTADLIAEQKMLAQKSLDYVTSTTEKFTGDN